MTREELRNLVVANIGNRNTTGMQNTINLAFNLGLIEIAKRHRFRLLRSEVTTAIVLNDVSVALPARTIEVVQAWVTDGTINNRRIHVKSKVYVKARWPEVSILPTGYPYIGYVEGGVFYFLPKSSGSYNVKMTVAKFPTPFSADSDENPLVGTDHSLVCFGTMYALRSLQQFPDSENWETQFEKSVKLDERTDKRSAAQEDEMDPHPGTEPESTLSGTPWLEPFIKD